MSDVCQLCRKFEPAWWCVDSEANRWLYACTDSDAVTVIESGAMYPVCSTCKKQIERGVRDDRRKHPRKVKWIRWT